MAFRHKKKKDEKENKYQHIDYHESLWHKMRRTILSSHYVIERFGINFGILCTLIIICLGFAYKNYVDYQNAIVNNQALYTKEITTSKTNITAEVLGVYDNKAHTKSFVLLDFKDVSSIPLNASKYQFFMAGENGHGGYAPIQGKPAGAFYIFGSTGYMGIYLVNKSGFKPQVLNIVGRINSQITDTGSINDTNDDAFNKYDQFRIRFNPGAVNVKYLKSLENTEEPAVADLYSEMILARQEKAARKTLNDDLNKMQIDLNKIQDYEHRLRVFDRVQVPKAPGYIRGDKIIKKHGQNYLKSTETITGGFDYNWQDSTVSNGYIRKIMKQNKMDPSMSDENFLDYMDKKRQDAAGAEGTDEKYNANIPDDSWRYLNGRKVDLQVGTGDDSDTDSNASMISKRAQLNKDIQGLESAWSAYIDDKKEYQTSDLEALLTLEATYSQVNHFAAINDKPTVLKIY